MPLGVAGEIPSKDWIAETCPTTKGGLSSMAIWIDLTSELRRSWQCELFKSLIEDIDK